MQAETEGGVTGIITDIQHFSVHDGPGIRTTVFVKGCNLRCFWCHNPETQHSKLELHYYPDRCIACGKCVDVCPESAHDLIDGIHAFHRDRCTACGACPEVCYPRALMMAGAERNASDVVATVLRDRPYYETSGGGLTISGWEPLMQPEFTRAILEECRANGIHTAVETAASVPWERIESILPVTDLVMMDIKSMDSEVHKRTTGVPNARILENAKRMSERGMPLIVRTPVIPGVNDDDESIRAIAEFTSGLESLVSYELLRFHAMAKSKYASLGLPFLAEGLSSPTNERMKHLTSVAASIESRTRVE
jgi:pyruvate formate lyase activating enzyme